MTFVVLTPSYAPDFDLCRELNRSVLDCTDVTHHLVVARRDHALFAQLEDARTRVWTTEEVVPRRMLSVPMVNAWVNLRRPYPPIRGWIMQQLVKLAAVARLEADVVLLADSDVTFVRPVTADILQERGRARLYRARDAVDSEMPRHIRWHQVARRLLGLPPADAPSLPDYICPLNVWDRQVVLALRDRIQRVTGRPWLEAIASELHFSEFILYGVFVDEVLQTSAASSSTLCHTYWGPGPLELTAVPEFVAALSPEDVAVMISAKTHTPRHVREDALARARALVEPLVA